MIARAVEIGCVTKVASLFDTSMKTFATLPATDIPPCPPILDGDYWIDEAVRLHSVAAKKSSKKSPNYTPVPRNSSSSSSR